MHYLQMELQAHEHRDELLREARERHLARALKSRGHSGCGLGQLSVRRLFGVLRRNPGYEAGSEEDGDAAPCLAGRLSMEKPRGGMLR